MKLSARMVCDGLDASYKAMLDGAGDPDASLGRPELYGGDGSFEAGKLYVLRADRLPQRAHAESGACLVCIGSSPYLRRYKERCCVITLSDDADFFSAFNAVQGIYDVYDAWEDDLTRIIDDDADISAMLDRSEAVFGNALYAIDGDFRIMGSSRLASELPSGTVFASNDGTNLDLRSFDIFLGDRDLATMEEHEPLLLEILDTVTLNCNLFESGAYSGCVTVHYAQRPYRESDKQALSFLARMLERAMRQLAGNPDDSRGSMRQAVQDLVEGYPLDAVGRAAFEKAAHDRRFVCMRLKLTNRLANLPIGYVRNMVESAFPKSITFEHHRNSVVSFIDLDELDASLPYQEAIASAVRPFIESMGMKAGLSDPVGDILQARLYYLEANAALENGALFGDGRPLYEFQDFILEDMVVGAMGEFPLELLYPEGLRTLVEHDASSPTSYLETLRCYLDNNMSVTKTAKELYVHRSTLLERLSRIKRELGLDLDDADVNLRMRLLLKAMQVRDELNAPEA